MNLLEWIQNCCRAVETRPKKAADPFNFLHIAVRGVDNEINHFEDVVLVSQALLLMNYTNELAGKMKIDPNLTKHQSVPYKYLTTPGSFQASLFQAFTEIKCLFGDANISMNRIELTQGVIGGEIECCLKSIRQGRSSTDTLINVSGSHIIRLTRNCGEICRASHAGFEKTKKVLYELMKGLENYRNNGESCFHSEFTKKQDRAARESQRQKAEKHQQQVKALGGYVTNYKRYPRENHKHMVYNILQKTLFVLEMNGLFSSPSETILSLGVTVVQNTISKEEWFIPHYLRAIKEAFEIFSVMGKEQETFRKVFAAMEKHYEGNYNRDMVCWAMEQFIKYRDDEERTLKRIKGEEEREYLRSQTNTRLSRNPDEATVVQIVECLQKIYISLTRLQMSWCSLAGFFDRVEQFAFKVQIPLKNMTLEESRKLTAISIETICLCQGIASFAGVFRALCHKLLIDDLSGDRIQLGRDCADEIASEQGRLKRKHEATRTRLQEKYETYV